MRMIKVECQGQSDKKCEKSYDGCREQIMYSEEETKITCKDGQVKINKKK